MKAREKHFVTPLPQATHKKKRHVKTNQKLSNCWICARRRRHTSDTPSAHVRVWQHWKSDLLEEWSNLRGGSERYSIIVVSEETWSHSVVLWTPLTLYCRTSVPLTPSIIQHVPFIFQHVPSIFQHIPSVFRHIPSIVKHIPLMFQDIPSKFQHIPFVTHSWCHRDAWGMSFCVNLMHLRIYQKTARTQA